MTIDTALKWIMAAKVAKGNRESSMNRYTWMSNNFVPWCKEQGILYINEPTIEHVDAFLNKKLNEERWGATTYNNRIKGFVSFFNYLVAKRKLKENPIKPGMLERLKNTAEKNRYYDQGTLDKLIPKIKKNIAMQRFIRWTYYTCARGSELREIRIKDIDLRIKKIIIRADIGKTGASVGKRHIPICQELHDLIIEEKLKEMPANWYIFGGKGIPGPKLMHDKYISRPFAKIKEDLGIDPRHTVYSFKHTRVVDLLVAGFDATKVMQLTGHTNWSSFQAYTRELGAVMDKQMIGNTVKLSI
jgi:integrase